MAKKNLKLRTMVAPAQTIIAAAYDENGKADACTLAFFSPISHVPPCVVIGINATQKRKTLQSILSSGAFTVSYPGNEQAKEADYLGVDSGYRTDKLANIGYTVSEGQAVHAPVINEMKLVLECEVVHTVTVGSHTQITGEIKNIQAGEEILDEKGRVLLERLDPMIYDEEQYCYHYIGEKSSDAFRPGAALKKELE